MLKTRLHIAVLGNQNYWQLVLLMLITALGMAVPQLGKADSANADLNEESGFFIPDNMHFYNPLKHSNGAEKTNYKPNTKNLDNKSLIEAAAHYRSNNMNATQRALNYQWLQQQHHSGKDIDYGSKVLSKLFKMGLQTYWNSVQSNAIRSNKMAPDANGRGFFTQDVSYDMKVSADKINISLEYEF